MFEARVKQASNPANLPPQGKSVDLYKCLIYISYMNQMGFGRMVKRMASCIILLELAFVSAGAPLGKWYWRNPLPQGNPLMDVKYLNGNFVAVGGAGTILTSSNAIQWTRRDSGTAMDLYGVAYGNGMFVVSGANGQVCTSSDGISWQSHSTGSTNALRGIAFGAGVFVVAENGGGFASIFGLLVSTNGVDWSRGLSGNYPAFNGITYAANLFVAVGGWDGGDVVTSTNGIVWSQGPYGSLQLNGVAFGNGTFVAVGANYYGSPGTISTSADGVNWTAQQSGTPNYLSGVGFGQNAFVAVGDSGTILWSPDGARWANKSPGIASRLFAVTYGNGVFAAVGSEGTILTSTNGNVWTNRVTGNNFILNGLAYGNNRFVAVGAGGKVTTSSDGLNWSNQNSGTLGDLYKIVFAEGLFVAVGPGIIQTSTNGTAWTLRSRLPATAVTYGNGMFLAVDGPKGAGVIISPNGIDWTLAATGASPFDVAYGNGVFIGVASSGPIYRSTDGTNWAQVINSPSTILNTVTFGNGRFVAADIYGGIIESQDGSTWSPVVHPSPRDSWNCVYYGNGLFIAGGYNNYGAQSLLTSADGTNWAVIPLGAKATINDIAYGAGTFVAVGANGAILQSDDLRIPWLTGQVDSSGEFKIVVTGEVGRQYRLQSSADLQTWNDTFVYTNSQFWMQFLDPAITNHSQGYYRAISP